MPDFIGVWVFVALLVLGYAFGRVAEVRHVRSLVARERASNALPAIASRRPPADGRAYAQRLVAGSVVVSSDYFKTFVAGLVNILGGRVTTFESLVDRARREAVLRMKAEAGALSAAYVFNVKFETARIAAGRVAAMEVLAYGTALVPTGDAPAADAGSGAEGAPVAPNVPAEKGAPVAAGAGSRPARPARTVRDGPIGPGAA